MMNLRHLKLHPHKKAPVTVATQLIEACTDFKTYSDGEHEHDLQVVISALNKYRNTLMIVIMRGSNLSWTIDGPPQSFLCMCPSLPRFATWESMAYGP